MPRILIVEDDENVRQFICRILKNEGYEVVETENGNVGIRMYREQPFDLVITDLFMPDKEGLEIITELKHNYPDAKIIAMSGGGQVLASDYLIIAKSLGALTTISKPFTINDFLTTVKNALFQ